MNSNAFDWLSSHADRTPDRTALVNTASGAERTYETVDERASRFSRALTDELGIESGDRVAILSRNSPTYVEALYGCAKAEALYVALNWRLAQPELEYIVDDADPSVLVYDPSFSDTVEGLRDVADIDHYVALPDPTMEPDTDSDDSADDPAADDPADDPAANESGNGSTVSSDDEEYETMLDTAGPGRHRMPPRDRSDTWGLLYTSGTTGRPKGVRQTFDMVLYNYLNIGIPSDLTSKDTTLNVLPFFHTGGLNLYTNPTLIAGGTALVQPTFDPSEALRVLEERATVFFGVPAIYQALYDEETFADRDLSSVHTWATGGAPMPEDLIETYAEEGIVIRQGMGMTETGPTVFLIDESRAVERAGSLGHPTPFVEIRVVDEENEEVPRGETGELLVRGPGVTPGYWEDPEAQADAFTGDWLHTGDVARRDEEGCVSIVDRKKNMFISGGENVYPAEIETVLHDHPTVSEAAVVPVPDERWGQVGNAFVVRSDDSLTADDVLEFCDERLAAYKVPAAVEFVDSLPRNAAGKIERPVLESRAE